MNKAKFKVGDKVRILNGSKIKDYTGGWAMSDDVGKIVTINFIDTHHFGDRIGYRMKECGCIFDERGLELVKSEAIVIYRNGNEVIAHNKVTGKKGVAKCNPADNFDFEIGAKLAFTRLFHKFKVGDKIIGTAEANSHYCITREGWRGIIVGIIDDTYIKVKSIHDSDEYDVNSKYFELDNSPKYFNGKVVCTMASGRWCTKGKIYEIKDGVIHDDDGDTMTRNPVKSVGELNANTISQFMEIVE